MSQPFTHTQWIEPTLSQQNLPQGTLFIVALPIGNLADITLRALHILAHSDIIAAEDTRHTKPLLLHYGISSKKLISLHQHNEIEQSHQIIELLKNKQRVALVSDAGTPAISDPGAKLVKQVLAANLSVSPIPGCSSLAAALSVSGIDHHTQHRFIGFFSTKHQSLTKQLQQIAQQNIPVVGFESPHRVTDTLKAIQNTLPQWDICIAREITKQFEDIQRIPTTQIDLWLNNHPKILGEFVLVLIPSKTNQETTSIEESTINVFELVHQLSQTLPASKAAAMLAKCSQTSKNDWYQLIVNQTQTNPVGE
jgi:16S rRNA (cytidine1402-2'-O)-methyltransferase